MSSCTTTTAYHLLLIVSLFCLSPSRFFPGFSGFRLIVRLCVIIAKISQDWKKEDIHKIPKKRIKPIMLGFTKSSFNLNRLLSHNINYKNLRFKGTDVVLSTLKSRNHLNLPRLPIPNLSDTLDRYVKSVKPLTLDSNFVDRKLNGDVSSFSRTSSLVDDASTSSLFLEAQASLLEKDKKRTSYPHFYFEHLWDEMYLTLRCPNPIHVSPA